MLELKQGVVSLLSWSLEDQHTVSTQSIFHLCLNPRKLNRLATMRQLAYLKKVVRIQVLA